MYVRFKRKSYRWVDNIVQIRLLLCHKTHMRKVLLILLSLIVFFYVTISPTVFAYGHEEDGASPAAKVEYELAYPGVLPDNPLHFLKATRDKIVRVLINDPVKRAEFDLLTSDKRIYAAKILMDRGKSELSLTTLSKSNNYMDAAITAARKSKREGRDVDAVLSNLEHAILKHEEVAKMILSRIDKKFSSQARKEIKRLSEFGKSVNKLSLK